MKRINIVLALLCSAVLATSCTKDEEFDPNRVIIGLGGDNTEMNEIDKWIWENVTRPYNIEVKYRWDRSELDYDKTLVPIDEDKVIPAIKALKRAWIEPYDLILGQEFIRAYAPKKYVFVGSLKYNGTTNTLGEAEGGRKIVLYRMNEFTHSDEELVRAIIKTAHHEFTHNLNQKIKYPLEFEEITPSGYEASWTNTSDEKACRLGFISNYASSSPTEDFAEMVGRICSFGRSYIEARIAQAENYWKSYNPTVDNAVVMSYDPAAALRTKEAMMCDYMDNVWGINMYPDEFATEGTPRSKGLVQLVQEAIADVVAGNY